MSDNTLVYGRNDGLPVTIQLSIANPAASATTDLTLSQGGSGFVVPAGHAFHPMCLSATSNADLTAGTATFQVISDGTELGAGPQAVLSDTVQRTVGVQRPNADPIGAGKVVGVSVTTNGAYAPVTADLDAVLVGVLLPV